MTSFLRTLRSPAARHLITDLARRQDALAGQSAAIHDTAPTISYLPSPFHDHLDDDYEQEWGTQVLFSSKVDEEDLQRIGIFPSLHQCTIARRFRNLQVEMKLTTKLSLMK